VDSSSGPLEESDADELAGLIGANRRYLAEWMPWAESTSNNVEECLSFIRLARKQDAGNDGFHAAIVEGAEIIGVISFHGIDWQNQSTSLGYWLAEDRKGKGTMTEVRGTPARLCSLLPELQVSARAVCVCGVSKSGQPLVN
jgi:RimJ/RimL family protein N-acetyltransferase